ncbi:MAG: DUF4411 family protein [Candidatus Accumulibacter sp.]|nr:DUF4411 family protein [Candidatus Accumulibacter propinquus]
MIEAWDNYPPGQFPGLWAWMADRVEKGLIRMSDIAVEEVGHKVPECIVWLRNANLRKISVSGAILLEAFRIKGMLDIEEDKYGSGVDENDLIIIATAKLNDCELITNEAFQAYASKQKRNWRIPLVCNMDTVNVPWIDFLGYLKRSKAVFG